QDYTNFVRDVLSRVDRLSPLQLRDLRETISKSSYSDLAEFVLDKTDPARPDPRVMPVASFLMDPNFKKTFDQLTMEEFEALSDSVKTLAHNGRDELKVLRAGEKEDFHAAIDQLAERMESLPLKEIREDIQKSVVGELFKRIGAAHWILESIFNRFDRNDP